MRSGKFDFLWLVPLDINVHKTHILFTKLDEP
jgi:hypothetical protein